jgi:hypothetical protein
MLLTAKTKEKYHSLFLAVEKENKKISMMGISLLSC